MKFTCKNNKKSNKKQKKYPLSKRKTTINKEKIFPLCNKKEQRF